MLHRFAIGLLPGNHPWRQIPLRDVPGIRVFECPSRRYVAVSDETFKALTFNSVPRGFLAQYVLTCKTSTQDGMEPASV